MKCDRCGKECKTPYWIIEMWETGKGNEHTQEGMMNNLVTNLKRRGKRPDKYCLKCIKGIKKYIGGI